MGQMTLSEFQVSPFQGIMCVNAPVTLSSPLNNLVISRLFNLLQPISTLFNYLCLVTPDSSARRARVKWVFFLNFLTLISLDIMNLYLSAAYLHGNGMNKPSFLKRKPP